MATTKQEINLSNKIVLRNVRGKVGKITIQPCIDPRTGKYPDCVKKVDSNGDMILSEKDRNDPNMVYFIKENESFEVVDGTVYNLDDVRDRFIWEAIKNCPYIAPDVDAKDTQGNSIIHGGRDRYGIAELYIERPGVESNRKVTKKKLRHDAEAYIYGDERGAEGRVLKAKLLGHKMDNVPDADVTYYLLEVADSDPEKIINLYRGGDTSIRLLFIEARDKHVINYKDRLYIYADNVVLGATDEAAILFLKDPKNANLLKLIKRDTFPELMETETDKKKTKD